jgi:aryl-alcohol dehydrogenase-like predicted oxidoreductase
LQTDYLDLYSLHGGTLDDPIHETIEAFERLKQQGKIRHYGISSIRPNVIREYVRRSGLVSVMMQYSLLDRRPEEQMLDLLQRHQIGVLARGSLAKGMLVNKPPKEHLGYAAEEVGKAAEAIAKVAGNRRSSAETAILFALHHPAITSAVVGIRTQQQLEEAIQVSMSAPLAEKEIKPLQEAIPKNRYEEHR